MQRNNSHSVIVGYLAWIFGFIGAHRFYYGKPITGTIWFFTLGLFFIGWIIDFFLIPSMDREADRSYIQGEVNYSASWLLLFFFGVFGVHRMYMGKWISGIIYLFTFGLCGLGILFDLWTLNDQIDELNTDCRQAFARYS
ncbi:NINE protein [Teredinibacter franksiae]|uniref:NINE protein n=1 Tax=Teredinibacter franksiae TaxID=2761453 RepID=UPI0016249E6E|nr:TM2 domain-containing protein [Teredinibacter franksiae]